MDRTAEDRDTGADAEAIEPELEGLEHGTHFLEIFSRHHLVLFHLKLYHTQW